jgi:hypothetical protein
VAIVKMGRSSFSRIALFLAAALGATFAANSACAQSNGQRLDAPVSEQAQSSASATASSPAKAALLRKAEVAYYVLQDQGLKSFQCNVQPNWSEIVTDTSQLVLVSQIQFSAVIDEQGNVQVTPFLPNGATIDPGLGSLVGGLQQTIGGFFKTWISFVLTPTFVQPDDDHLVFSAQSDGNHFAKTSPDMSVEFVLTNDALITAFKVVETSMTLVTQPSYISTDKGLLLTATNTVIDQGHGKQQVNFQLQYQDVQGFKLPALVAYQVILPSQSAPIDLSFGFGGYQIAKR